MRTNAGVWQHRGVDERIGRGLRELVLEARDLLEKLLVGALEACPAPCLHLGVHRLHCLFAVAVDYHVLVLGRALERYLDRQEAGLGSASAALEALAHVPGMVFPKNHRSSTGVLLFVEVALGTSHHAVAVVSPCPHIGGIARPAR